MDIKELKDIALELMDALAAKKLGEVELELDNAKIKIKADVYKRQPQSRRGSQ